MSINHSTSLVLLNQPNDALDFRSVDLQPSEIHRFIILKLLCDGGQARLWTALDPSDPDHCKVIKQYDLFPDRNESHSQQQDSETLARLDHFQYEMKIYKVLKQCSSLFRHILFPEFQYYDSVKQHGYVVFPFIDTPLQMEDFLLQLDSVTLLKQMLAMTKTLYALHRCGIVHGDIKPKNILWTRHRSQTETCTYLIDLGSAQFYFPHITMNRQVGTRRFQAPELLWCRENEKEFKTSNTSKASKTSRPKEYSVKYFGSTLHRSIDVWALGCTFLWWIHPHLTSCSLDGEDKKSSTNFFSSSLIHSWFDYSHHYPRRCKHLSLTRWMSRMNCPLHRISLIHTLEDVLSGMLQPDPAKRVSAKHAARQIKRLMEFETAKNSANHKI